MPDVAMSRLQLVDNSRRRADGKRIHVIVPWQLVTIEGFPPMLEEVDTLVTSPTATTTKEITGILFVDWDVFQAQNGVGGNSGGLRYA